MTQRQNGSITASNQGREIYLKLSGELRVTVCMSLNHCIDNFLELKNVDSVIVDLVDAGQADSTIMGLLARFAIECQRRFQVRPMLWCQMEDLRKLMAMSLDEVYDLVTFTREQESATRNYRQLIQLQSMSTDDVDAPGLRETIIEAHNRLIALDSDQADQFMAVVEALRNASYGDRDGSSSGKKSRATLA